MLQCLARTARRVPPVPGLPGQDETKSGGEWLDPGPTRAQLESDEKTRMQTTGRTRGWSHPVTANHVPGPPRRRLRPLLYWRSRPTRTEINPASSRLLCRPSRRPQGTPRADGPNLGAHFAFPLLSPWLFMHVPPSACPSPGPRGRHQQVSVQAAPSAPISTHCRTSTAAIYPLVAANPFLSMSLLRQDMFRLLRKEVRYSRLHLA